MIRVKSTTHWPITAGQSPIGHADKIRTNVEMRICLHLHSPSTLALWTEGSDLAIRSLSDHSGMVSVHKERGITSSQRLYWNITNIFPCYSPLKGVLQVLLQPRHVWVNADLLVAPQLGTGGEMRRGTCIKKNTMPLKVCKQNVYTQKCVNKVDEHRGGAKGKCCSYIPRILLSGFPKQTSIHAQRLFTNGRHTLSRPSDRIITLLSMRRKALTFT